jgi:sortase A
VTVWLVVFGCLMFLVLYGMEPLFAQRTQRSLLESYRVDVEHASKATDSLAGVKLPTTAPDSGDAVGILEVGRLQLQQVVVEGVQSADTAGGPGHVPGTAGLGQPGNAVVVGRYAAFGGPFNEIGSLHRGERLLVTTTEGQSVYDVDSVGDHRIVAGPATSAADASGGLGAVANPAAGGAATPTTEKPDPLRDEVVTTGDLYGPSTDDRLTLVTSASAAPWNSERATVVVAKLEGQPFTPTPQNGRTDSQTGQQGDASAWAPLVLALLALGGAIAAAVLLYRRSSPRVAYLVTAAPLIVFTIVAAESLARLFPAWM